MNIVFANSTRGWGGVNTWALDAARSLHQKGHGIKILAREGRFASRCADAGLAVTMTQYGMDFHPLVLRRFMGLLKAWETDAVIVNIAKELRTVGVAARLLGIPVVLRVGLPGDMKNRPKVRLLHRWMRPKVLAPCEYIKTGLLERLPFVSPDEVTVIHTGKVPAEAAPAGVGKPLRIIATSQLNPDKGHGELLASLAEAMAQGLEFQVDILGTGRIEEGLKTRTRELGLAERVHFLGYQADVLGQLKKADVFVLPSFSEGLPNSLMEAMSQGLVPLSRRVGGVEEIFPTELGHLLFDDQAGLTRALVSILHAPPETLLHYKKTAWEQCCRAFALDGQVTRLEAWLDSLTS